MNMELLKTISFWLIWGTGLFTFLWLFCVAFDKAFRNLLASYAILGDFVSFIKKRNNQAKKVKMKE